MEVFNLFEREYLISLSYIEDNYSSQYVDIRYFEFDFISNYIYKYLFNISNQKNIICSTKIDSQKIAENNNLSELFFSPLLKRNNISNDFINIISLINNHIDSKKNDENFFVYWCIKNIFNNVFMHNAIYFNLKEDQFLNIVKYKFTHSKYVSINDLIIFGRKLMLELLQIKMYQGTKMVDILDEDKELIDGYIKGYLSIYDRCVNIDLYNKYLTDTNGLLFLLEYIKEEIFHGKNQEKTKESRETLNTNFSEIELIRISNELVNQNYISNDLDLFLSCFGYREEKKGYIIWKSTNTEFEIFISEIVQKEVNPVNQLKALPRNKINLWFLDIKSKQINPVKKMSCGIKTYNIYKIIHP